MISASKTTYIHYNLKILRPKVTKNIKNLRRKFCEFPPRVLLYLHKVFFQFLNQSNCKNTNTNIYFYIISSKSIFRSVCLCRIWIWRRYNAHLKNGNKLWRFLQTIRVSKWFKMKILDIRCKMLDCCHSH